MIPADTGNDDKMTGAPDRFGRQSSPTGLKTVRSQLWISPSTHRHRNLFLQITGKPPSWGEHHLVWDEIALDFQLPSEEAGVRG